MLRLQKFSFRFAEQVLNSKLTLKHEVEDILSDPSIDIRSLSRPKFNEILGEKFVERGWEDQSSVFNKPNDPIAKLDFVKERIGVEVAFGHRSFIGTDLLKFQAASDSSVDKIDAGIYIVTTDNFQTEMKKTYAQNWEGSLTFEKAVRYLPNFRNTMQLPIYVLGIDLSTAPETTKSHTRVKSSVVRKPMNEETRLQNHQPTTNKGEEKESAKTWDIFVSHASEDKDEIVRPLAERLVKLGYKVWYDEFELKVGDSLRRSIDKGLANSRYGVVILSPNFFAKEWPKKELDGLTARERDGKKVILPVWHRVDESYIRKFSPMLADKVAAKTSEGLDVVAMKIKRAIDLDVWESRKTEESETTNRKGVDITGSDTSRVTPVSLRKEVSAHFNPTSHESQQNVELNKLTLRDLLHDEDLRHKIEEVVMKRVFSRIPGITISLTLDRNLEVHMTHEFFNQDTFRRGQHLENLNYKKIMRFSRIMKNLAVEAVTKNKYIAWVVKSNPQLTEANLNLKIAFRLLYASDKRSDDTSASEIVHYLEKEWAEIEEKLQMNDYVFAW